MTFKQHYGPEPQPDDEYGWMWYERKLVWSAAIAAERARCTALIWEHRGKCASD